MARLTHRHENHRGLIPDDQLGDGSGFDQEYPFELPYAPGIVIELTNRSGVTIQPGDVVIYPDPSNDDAFTVTSISALATSGVGVIIGNHPVYNGSNGKVFTAGLLNSSNFQRGSNFNVNGSNLTRGRYVYTALSRTAAENAAIGEGAFGQVMRSGTNPVIYLWGHTRRSDGFQ
jgi:hypothetical protein